MVSDMLRGLQVMFIDVDVNQAESHKWVWHILKTHMTRFIFYFPRYKNTYDTCFQSNFSREIDWEWSQICQRTPSLAHRRRQRQRSWVPQEGLSYGYVEGHMTLDDFSWTDLEVLNAPCTEFISFQREAPPPHLREKAEVYSSRILFFLQHYVNKYLQY